MTKTKQQLRAEAVERLKNSAAARFKPDAAIIAIVGGRVGQVDWSLECDALIDLLTDECETECYECSKLAELMAENNALREIVGNIEAPTDAGEASIASVEAFIEKQTEHEQDSREKLEADDMPEGDAVEIMRKSAKGFQGGTGNVMKNAKMLLGMNVESGLDSVLLETLADMVERDYVKRERIEGVMDADRELVAENIRLTSECDELKRKLEVADRHEFESDQMCDECKWRTDEQLAELIAERDEWKAKAEGSSKVRVGSSSAKRAAAVERLKDARYHTLADYVRAMLGWGHEPHFEDSRDALIDLLTDDDDCGHSADMSAKDADCVRDGGEMSDVDSRDNGWYLRYDGYMTSKSNYLRISGFKAARSLDNRKNLVFVKFMGGKEADCRVYAPKLDVCENLHDSSKDTQKPRSREADSGNVSDSDGENLHVELDTREKLEEDVRDEVGHFFAWQEKRKQFANKIIGWLDRQAAITERETKLRELYRFEKNHRWHIDSIEEVNRKLNERIAELQAKVDEYEKAAQGEFVVPLEDAMRFTTDPPGYVKAHIAKLQAKADRLTRENVALAHDLGECMAERDALRRENARLSSDEFYLRCTLVDMDGEVVS